MTPTVLRALCGILLLALAPAVAGAEAGRGPDPVFRVELPDSLKDGPQDGRLLLIFAPADQSPERALQFTKSSSRITPSGPPPPAASRAATV